MTNVAYITSGKIGIHRFTYNELSELDKKGVKFILCLTQLKSGPVMPDNNWMVVEARLMNAISQFISLGISKGVFFRLLREAMKLKVLPYFLISLSFYKELKDSDITSIHCQMGGKKLYIGYFLKILLKKPLSVTIHAHELYERAVYDHNKKIQKLYSYCDKVITISQFNSKIIKDKFGVKDDKIEIIRLFPEIDSHQYVQNKAKILVVANWVAKKGYDILFEAAKKISRTDFVIWVVGGSTESSDSMDLPKLIKDYDISDKVAILGRQGTPVLDILFNACDIFCLPSYTSFYNDGNPADREGIPVALMEAMAWGKPVIATNHAGNSELVSELLVEEQNVNDLIDKLNYVLDHKDKWNEMGEINKKIIKEKYSKDNIDNLISTFEELG